MDHWINACEVNLRLKVNLVVS